MTKEPQTALSYDRLDYIRTRFKQLDNAQPISYAIELRVLRDDIITALDMAFEYLIQNEAAKEVHDALKI